MLKSFKYAINGVQDALKSEPNLRFHFVAALATIVIAKILKFNNLEFVALLIIISIVITLELINTVIEKVVDLHSKEISEEARQIKDISAAVVLFGASIALISELFLFGPKLW